jgi:pimeloyl-ACP methyl ester carboxylesterase
MRLLFVHGIAQQDYDEAQLLGIWTDHLLDHGLDAARLRASCPEMAYYGDRLFAWTQGGAANAVPMGPIGADAELDFLSKALDEMSAAAGLDEDEIDGLATHAAITDGASAVAQSTWAGRRAVAIVSLLERLSPLRGQFALKVIRQAYVYLADKGARRDIDDAVRERVGTGELVIVSHSLGTVIAFNLLRELAATGAQVHVPLLVTLGSPLALTEVKKRVGGSFEMPSIISTWSNFYDRGDPVTLGRALGSGFSAAIADTIVNNNTQNGHSIAGYLDDRELIDQLSMVL